MFDALEQRWSGTVEPVEADEEVMSMGMTDRVAGVGGVLELRAALGHTDCPVAPELFRLAG